MLWVVMLRGEKPTFLANARVVQTEHLLADDIEFMW